MGAAAISTKTKRPRPAAKPRAAAKPRTATKPRAAANPKAVSRQQAATKAPARSRVVPSTGLRALTPVVAVGRTAVAVGGLADCGVVMGMTRSRAWIVVLGVLLGGIVALNVWGLSLNASSSATSAKIDALERSNSVLRTRVATKLSNSKIEAAAAQLGLAVPAADQVEYLKASDSDVNRAAKRLSEGAIAAVAAAVAPPAVDPAIDPVTGAPVDPAADPTITAPLTDTTAVAPADPATAPVTDPAATTTDPAATAPVATDTAATTTPPATDPATGAVAP